jgi:hypothetical protein
MQYRNAQYNAFGTIDCEINHPVYGWIPFTADPKDVEPLGKQVFDAAKGKAAAYIAPPPPPEPTPEETLAAERTAMRASPAQMRLTLHRMSLLAQVQAIADADPEASIVWEYATVIERNSPLVTALGGDNGFTPEQIDNIFRAATEV